MTASFDQINIKIDEKVKDKIFNTFILTSAVKYSSIAAEYTAAVAPTLP